MTENAKNTAAQNTIQDPPEYNAENAENPKEGSDWLGGPQNGNETPSGSDYSKHRFDETGSEAVSVTWFGSESGHEKKAPKGSFGEPQNQARNPQTGEFQKPSNIENAKNPKEGSDWLGGPQNGNEAPSTSTEGTYQSTAHSTGYTDQLGSADWLGGPQNGDETPSESSTNSQEAVDFNNPMPLSVLLTTNEASGMYLTPVPGGLIPYTGSSDKKMISEWLKDPRLGWFMNKTFLFTKSNDQYPNRIVIQSLEDGVLLMGFYV
jgi:hypothetical protein